METDMTASKREYTAEFKEEAVRLVISSKKSCAEIARNLGIQPHLVVRWKQHHEQQTAAGRPQFTGRGVAALSDSRISNVNSKLLVRNAIF